mgnify:CR=1 FL=1
MYNSGKTMMYSVDGFRITIHGRGAHGAYPHSSIDPINIGVHVYLALESLIAREADPGKACVLTIGNFSAGSAPNIISEVPPLVCDPAMTDEMVSYMEELPIPGLTPVPDTSASASEDFAIIAERVPSVFMYLSAGYMDERGDAPAHNPKVQFNEDVCPIGSACLAHCAVRWLEEHQ